MCSKKTHTFSWYKCWFSLDATNFNFGSHIAPHVLKSAFLFLFSRLHLVLDNIFPCSRGHLICQLFN